MADQEQQQQQAAADRRYYPIDCTTGAPVRCEHCGGYKWELDDGRNGVLSLWCLECRTASIMFLSDRAAAAAAAADQTAAGAANTQQGVTHGN